MTNFCRIDCEKCPLSKTNNSFGMDCIRLQSDYPERAVEIVQQWSDDHPLKTYKEDFYEKFPTARKSYNECPPACRYNIYGDEGNGCVCKSCTECWNEPMPETTESEAKNEHS